MDEIAQPMNRGNWPIAAAMINFPGVLPDGSLVQEQNVHQWAESLRQVANAGFTEVDPTDSWLRVADLSPARLSEFQFLLKSLGLNVPAISTSRRSVIDPVHGAAYLEYSHRVIDTAAGLGAKAVCFGLFGVNPGTEERTLVLTASGVKNPDDPAIYRKAVERIHELGKHAADWASKFRSKCMKTPTSAPPTAPCDSSVTSTCRRSASTPISATLFACTGL